MKRLVVIFLSIVWLALPPAAPAIRETATPYSRAGYGRALPGSAGKEAGRVFC
jgi:hypothetical protein